MSVTVTKDTHDGDGSDERFSGDSTVSRAHVASEREVTRRTSNKERKRGRRVDVVILRLLKRDEFVIAIHNAECRGIGYSAQTSNQTRNK